MKKILIVIDMQHDFIDGVLGTLEAQAIVPKVREKVNWYVDNNYPVIFTRDTHDKNYLQTTEGKKLPIPHCIKWTKGWQIGFDIVPGMYKVIDKAAFGYRGWDFCINDVCNKKLFNINDITIEICGVCSDICVITNAILIKTYFPDCDIIVDASCCAGSTPEKHKAALEVMKSCQIEVIGE